MHKACGVGLVCLTHCVLVAVLHSRRCWLLGSLGWVEVWFWHRGAGFGVVDDSVGCDCPTCAPLRGVHIWPICEFAREHGSTCINMKWAVSAVGMHAPYGVVLRDTATEYFGRGGLRARSTNRVV